MAVRLLLEDLDNADVVIFTINSAQDGSVDDLDVTWWSMLLRAADQLRESARAAREPVAIVVGWQRWTHADRRVLTALSADDAESAMTVRSEADAGHPGRRGPDIRRLLRSAMSSVHRFTAREP
jgi:hypothetical protein